MNRGTAQWGGVVEKVIPDPSGAREARIAKYPDGTFGFEEWQLFEEHGVQYWSPTTRGRTLTDSAEAAEREARAQVDWLIGVTDADDQG
jgi:hypothetical protein